MREQANLSPKAAGVFRVYRREHRRQLSYDNFFLPFGDQLSGENRWIKPVYLIPWDVLEDDYAAQFCNAF